VENEVVKSKSGKDDKFEISKVVGSLNDIMVSVCSKNPSSENVYAACACAGKILEFLKFNLEIKRDKIKQEKYPNIR